MSNRAEDLEQLIKNSTVTTDAYAAWLDNAVTQRFLAEVELELYSEQENQVSAWGSDIESIALGCARNAATCRKLEEVLDWKPHELLSVIE